MALKLDIYNIIKGPIISDKAYKLNKGLNQLVLEVHPKANKILVKQALEKLFNVKVKKVRMLISKYTVSGRMQRRYIAHPSIKKEKRAFITLAEGYSLDLFEQMGASAKEQALKSNAE